MRILLVIFFSSLLGACGSGDSSNLQLEEVAGSTEPDSETASVNDAVNGDVNNQAAEGVSAPSFNANSAAVMAVAVSGEANAYSFSVTVQSPDLGCSQYADWWEIIQPDGRLVFRRILTHSHVDEQPFTRSGGPVNLAANDNVIVRVHMNNLGYGEQVLTGNVQAGFTSTTLETVFAQTLEFSEPLPSGCAF